MRRKWASVLSTQYYSEHGAYAPTLHAIDDYSSEFASVPRVLKVVEKRGGMDFLKLRRGDFRGYSKSIPERELPLDLVWFDCGGPHEYEDLIREYWSLINQDHGLLLLHYMYWLFWVESGDVLRPKNSIGAIDAEVRMMISPIVNDIKRQQIQSGTSPSFEVVSLLEPHKEVQGSVTMIRKMAPASRYHQTPMDTEMEVILGERAGSFGRL